MNASWYRALTLSERTALRQAGDATACSTGDIGLAQRRYQRWLAEPPFDDESLFCRFLASIGLEEAEFRSLLGEPPEDLQRRCPEYPSWLQEITAVLTSRETLPPTPELAEAPVFARVAEPFVRRGFERLRQEARQLQGARGDLPFDPDAIAVDLLRHLYKRLMGMLGRTLVLELHVAARQGQLSGETPEERFQSFADRLRREEAAWALLEEYPVLARLVTQAIMDWVDFGLDFLAHLVADWDVLREAFGLGSDPVSLVEVTGSLGDSHHGGRSVFLLRFSSGSRLTYKPKPLAAELWFQELLAWLNARGACPPLRTVKILDRGTYGWTEFVHARGCTDPLEVERFYRRQGGYLALLYLLDATDLHHENLIAEGEHPVMIDLEALFHPRSLWQRSLPGEKRPADELIHETVLRVGLLPQRIWSDGVNEGVDLSGLGAAKGQQTPFSVLQLEAQGTDRMRFVRERAELQAAENHPRLNGEDVDLLDHAGAIAEGFVSTYRLLLEHRDALLEDGGPIASFSEVPVRVIARPTRLYSILLGESFHPNLLRDALDRDRLLRKLWVGAEERPLLAELIPFEVQDLERGDVPLFTTRPATRDLWTSSGERIEGFLEESGLERVRERFRQAGECDLKLQLSIVRGSLTALTLNSMQPDPVPRRLEEAARPIERERLLAGACAIGDRLEGLAVRAGATASWFGYDTAGAGSWSFAPLGYDLYGGLGGIALFLAHLGAISGEERYTRLGRAAFETARSRLRRAPSALPTIGAFTGWGGWIYTLSRLGLLWQDASLLDEAERAVSTLGELIECDESLDVVGGSAGCLLALLRLNRLRPSEHALAAALRCGDRLVYRARPMECGLGWALERAGPRPLAGLSHGAAGIAWSLLELACASGEERFREVALQGIEYERSLFSPSDSNWPDLRPRQDDSEDETRRFECSWCHGAPGIGLARLASLPYMDDPEMRREIAQAIETTLARGLGRSHCLCHGSLGNLDFLLTASRALGHRALGGRVERLGATIVQDAEARSWQCGTPGQVETPGLLVGLAGIGYEFLRLAEPGQVPSVLILETA